MVTCLLTITIKVNISSSAESDFDGGNQNEECKDWPRFLELDPWQWLGHRWKQRLKTTLGLTKVAQNQGTRKRPPNGGRFCFGCLKRVPSSDWRVARSPVRR